MAVSNLTRNLRDGELRIKDGTSGTPQSLTVLLDEGDLRWAVRSNTIEVKDRGSITDGHTRKGDEEPVSLSFTVKWTQLIGKAGNPADPLQLYEMLMFTSGADVVSTSPDGEQETLTMEFTVVDPAGVAGEKITFSKVYRESLTMTEGDDANLIAFSGRAFETEPLVERV
ncbi:MAG: hypothetical protein DWQ34_06090 [Planctomycetota bacterium]|nr:MAG: hypothetical protein DWQ29_23290 [Planctomycetota bacterium]REJ95470.1 MAG: hypothetical protein DWQ34_06090 [Planctomycetota bacterium]REK26535.1 MAG: hypothetical protein DWQ41_09730 [Planctomycetota bacterium]REK33988.1 MAG: hypothetical protein DWQ45_14285 [Planctomycetota bacterium]